MRRRRILLGLVVAAAVPGAVLAQKPPPRRIGFITLASLSDPRIEGFRKGMRELGYVEGLSIAVDWRSADGDAERLPSLARELARTKPDLIVAAQTQAISAAKRAAPGTPIIFVATPDPVSSGFVNSLARPGGNLTGLSTSAADIGAKQIEILRSALPKVSTMAVLANPTNNASVVVRRMVTSAAMDMKLQSLSLDAQSVAEVGEAFAEARRAGADAVVVAVDGFFIQARALIAEQALRHRLPTMFTQREHAAAGGLMSYGPNITMQYQRVAHYVDRILKGGKAAEMPVEQPNLYELVLNLRTAKALGLALPQALLARADEVLQ
jgi:putative ABC transport system substrate-binding protein